MIFLLHFVEAACFLTRYKWLELIEYWLFQASLVAQTIKDLSAVLETQVHSLSQ